MGLLAVTLLGCDLSALVSPAIMPRQDTNAVTGIDWDSASRVESLLKGTTGAGAYQVDLVDFEPSDAAISHRLFPDYLSAIAFAEKQGVTNFLPSADQVNALTKQVNDGLYARLELALENGEGGFQAKPEWLQAWLHQASTLDVQARLAGGLQLSGTKPSVSAAVSTRAQDGIAGFEQDLMAAKPIGFFTWSDPLKTIFRRDRFLQRWFPQPDRSDRAWLVKDGRVVANAEANLQEGLAAARALTGPARQSYEKTLSFYQRMTNPFSGYSPLDLERLAATGKGAPDILSAMQTASSPFLKYWALLPPSTSPEAELFFRMEQIGTLQPGEDRMQALIDAIKTGELSLAPTAQSGFYAFQQHALEALLKVQTLPEGGVVTFGEAYRRRLEEAFKTGMAKARETHAKQLDLFPAPGSAPALPMGFVVEPLPTFYERLANGYAFLKQQVLPLFEQSFLTVTPILTEGGVAGQTTLAGAVDEAEMLMKGLSILSQADLGLQAVSATDNAAATLAGRWLQKIGSDPRLGVDTRVAVPVNQYTDSTGKPMVQYWGTAGVTLSKLRVAPKGSTTDRTYWIATDKFLFFDRPYAAGPLDRDAYRRILDGAINLEAAKTALENS